MLRITQSKSAAGAKAYYSEAYYQEGQSKSLDYYSEKDQVIGKWGGKGAEKLGLGEDISKRDFWNLCDNINPLTGKKLTGRNDTDRTVGYDFTLNASKSVSLAYAFANDEVKKQILEAFRGAVTDTMNEIETGMQARVRSKGKNENRETGNIVYGEFIHFTTRPINFVPDPHLHSHCFVFNCSWDSEEDKWKAGQFRQIKQDAPYYQAVFHSKLAERLEKIGFETERTKDGFDLKGLEKETLDKFSRRTVEIEEYAKENGITDERQKSQIGAKTREAKRTETTPEAEFKEWKSRLTAEELYIIQNLKKDNGSYANDNSNDTAAKEALEYSLNHHLERKSVASDKEILATAIKSSIGSASPEAIKEEFKNNKDILSVRENLRTFITTKEALNEEKLLIENANSFKNRFRPINENYQIKADFLDQQQKEAVNHALTTSDGITIIVGKAGTGKTTLMKEVQQGIQEAGKEIFAYAPSAKASRDVQRREGFTTADTVASLILNKSEHHKLKNQVIWVDEAGMLSNKDLNKIFAIAKEQNSRIILSGDTGQHNSVERGDSLRTVQKYAGIAPITVSKIQRQKNAGYRDAVKLISEANIEKGFKKLDSIGAINEIADSGDRLKAIANDYYSSTYTKRGQKNVQVIAPTHAECESVTNEIRRKLKEENIISKDEKEFEVFKNLQLTSAEKQNIESYKTGNILSFHQNIKGIKAGSKLEITNHFDNTIIAKDKTGKEYCIPILLSRNFNVFEIKKIKVAVGDKINPTSNGKTVEGVHIFNGTSFNAIGFNKQGIKLSNGSTLPNDFGHFNFAYVKTSHSSQGNTCDKIIISQSSATFKASSQEQFYVSISRGRQSASIFTDNKTDLLQAVSHSAQRISATELMEKMNVAAQNYHRSLFQKAKEMAVQTMDKFKTSITKSI